MNEEPQSDRPQARIEEINIGPTQRYILLAVGWFFVAIGAVGAVLPVIPTTPFLLISLWAFSRSSVTLHAWLYTHRIYGPYLVAWDRYRVIPPRAKILAVTLMTSGWLFVTLFYATDWVLPTVLATIHVAVAVYILSRPSYPPLDAGQDSSADTLNRDAA